MNDHVCTVFDDLVHSCRPLLGAYASDYGWTGKGYHAQMSYHEFRISRRLDLVHAFAWPGKIPFFDSGVRKLAVRDDTWPVHNWKPAQTWRAASGGDDQVDKRIDAAAQACRDLAPKKIMLIVWHEPENDVGKAGDADQYRAMWRHVRRRFDDAGVDNVVWGMAYMNYPKWDSLIDDLYPGDDIVDWVWFNGYGSAQRPHVADNVSRFLDKLSERGLGDGKPRGVVEWGVDRVDADTAVEYYDGAAQLLSRDPSWLRQIKAWMVFDSPGAHDQSGLRLGYDDRGGWFPAKMAAYRRFASHPAFTCPETERNPR